MILRRVAGFADGRTRGLHQRPGGSAVQDLESGSAPRWWKIHGQHDERALVDASTHRRLLDAVRRP